MMVLLVLLATSVAWFVTGWLARDVGRGDPRFLDTGWPPRSADDRLREGR